VREKRLNGFSALIYDCDGVIFDSLEANFIFYSIILEHFGLQPPDRENKEIMHLLHTSASREVLAHFFESDGRCKAALNFAGTIDYRLLLPYMKLEDGFRETVDSLQGSVRLAICTNRSTSMEMLLEHFGLASYFSCVMTAARVSHPKPHPEPLLKLLEYYAIEPGEALFVGDSELDCQASRAAGVPFIAYKSDMPCLARIDRHQDILALLGAAKKEGV
jgi:HAD superfamily hydrolase (TIGR01509 family)